MAGLGGGPTPGGISGPDQDHLLYLYPELNPIISLRIIIVETGGPRRMALAAGISHISKKVVVKQMKSEDLADCDFCCRDPFFVVLV